MKKEYAAATMEKQKRKQKLREKAKRTEGKPEICYDKNRNATRAAVNGHLMVRLAAAVA